MAFDPYNLVLGPDGVFRVADDTVTVGSSLTPEEQARLRGERWQAAAGENARIRDQAAFERTARQGGTLRPDQMEGARPASRVASVGRGAAAGSRGGPVGAILGGALGPVLADRPEDVAPTATLGAAAGYGASKALPAMRMPSVSLPSLGTVGRFAGNAALLAPGAISAFQQPSTEEMAGRLGFSENMVRDYPGVTSALGAVNELGFGIPGYVNRQINRWQYGDPVEATAPRPALEPPPQQAAPIPGDVPNYVEMASQRPPVAAPPVAAQQMPAQQAAQAPAQMPRTALEPVVGGELMPQQPSSRMDALMSRLESESGQVSKMFEDYQRQSGSVVPQNLNAMDKWSALAKGLGAAAMMTAFPGFGLLASLGIGGLVGMKTLDKRRDAYQKGALQEQARLADVFKSGLDAAKQQRGALGDYAGAVQEQQNFDEGQRQFNANLALNQAKEMRLARQASIDGAQLKQAANGEYVFMYPNGAIRRTGQMGPLTSQSGQRYSVPGAVTSRMRELREAGGDPSNLYQTALQQVMVEGGQPDADVEAYLQ